MKLHKMYFRGQGQSNKSEKIYMLKWAYPPLSIFNQSKFPSFELLGVGGEKGKQTKIALVK